MSAVHAEGPKMAARRLITEAMRRDPSMPQDWKSEALHVYTDASGRTLFWVAKVRLPDGSKIMRPMFLDGDQYRLGKPTFDRGQAPLYRLPELVKADQGAPVYLVEGESCADALAELGLIATTSGGASSAGGADWSPLAGREVRIWPDNDEPGARYGAEVADILRALDCRVSILAVDELGLPPKSDCIDWLRAHPGSVDADVQALPWRELSDPVADDAGQAWPDDGDDEGGRRSQTDLIVEFVTEAYELFRDDSRVSYAKGRADGLVYRIDSASFRDRLAAEFFEQQGKAIRDQALREAKMTLQGLASKDERVVNVRVAGADGDYWLDLGNRADNLAVHLVPGAWSIESSSMMFFRSESQQPLPVPIRGGDVSLLWRIANVPEQDRLLVITWLIDCLRPDTPYPLLELLGEHGSAKSTTQTALRRIIDPNAADLRSVPRSAEDLYIAGGANHVISIENVSFLRPELQDAMCSIATGGAFQKRRLYSDGDEYVVRCKRPIIINGIAASVTQQDLVSRAITAELPTIGDAQTRGRLDAEFEEARASILGGLLDIAAVALEHLPSMTLPAHERPRLIEFAYLGMAVARAMGREAGEFMAAFKRVQRSGIERTLDGSPVAAALLEYLDVRGGFTQDMSAGDWLKALEMFRPQRCESWPHSAKGMGDTLRRIAPSLRQIGIECRSMGKVGGAGKWRIGPNKFPESSHESPHVLPNGAGESETAGLVDFQDMKTKNYLDKWRDDDPKPNKFYESSHECPASPAGNQADDSEYF